MKRCAKLLLAISLLFSVVLQIQAYPNLPLKNLFTVLKQDHIGFGHALLHSDWIENVYQYAEGGPHKNIASEGERQQYRADKENDHVANLVRTLWFRFRSENDLEPAQEPKDVFKPLDSELFGVFINLVYQLAEKGRVESAIEGMNEYGNLENEIKNIKLNKLAIDLKKCKKEMEQQLGGERPGNLLQTYKNAERFFGETKKKSGNEKKKIGAKYKTLVGQAAGEEKKKFNVQKADEMRKLDEPVEQAENNYVMSLAGYVGDLARQVEKKDIRCNIQNALKQLQEREALQKKLESIKKPDPKEIKVLEKLKQRGKEIGKQEAKLKKGKLQQFQFLLTAARNALKTQSERYVPGTVEGILWAFFFHKINKECATVDEKIKAINTCLSQLDDKYKNEEFAGEVNLQDRYDKEDFDDFGAQLKGQGVNVQVKNMLSNYDLSLQYLIYMLAGKFPKAPSGGSFGFEYDTKDHKITVAKPNCFEKAMLDFFSVLWHNPETGRYDNTLFPESIVKDGQINAQADFKKLEEALKYFYLADEKIKGKKRVEEEEYSFTHKKKWTSLAKLKEIMGQEYREEFQKLSIDEVPVSEIASGRIGQVFMNLVSDKEGIVYNTRNTYSKSDKKIFELYPGVKNFVKLVCYFYGIDEEKVNGRDGEFDVSKLGELLSTKQRKITFKKRGSKDMPNEIEVAVRDYKNNFYFDMTVDIMDGHVELRLPARETSGFEVVQKEVPGILLRLLSKNLSQRGLKEGVASLLVLQVSKELLAQNVAWNIELLNLIYYSLLMANDGVKLAIVGDILQREGKLHDPLKGLVVNLIDDLFSLDDDYFTYRLIKDIIFAKDSEVASYLKSEKLSELTRDKKPKDIFYEFLEHFECSKEDLVKIYNFLKVTEDDESLFSVQKAYNILWDLLEKNYPGNAVYFIETYNKFTSKDIEKFWLLILKKGWIDLVKLILEKFGCIETNPDDQTTPLIEVLRDGFPEIAKLLLNKCDELYINQKVVNKEDVNKRESAAEIALKKGYMDIFEMIINRPDISWDSLKSDLVYDEGVLRQLAHMGRKDLIEFLLNRFKNIDSTSLFHGFLGSIGNDDIQQLFLKHPAIDVEKSLQGIKELWLSIVQNGWIDVVKLMLDKFGCIATNPKYDKTTPLIEALRRGFPDIAKLLLGTCKDVYINQRVKKENRYESAAEIALQKGYIDIFEMIIKRPEVSWESLECDLVYGGGVLRELAEMGRKDLITFIFDRFRVDPGSLFDGFRGAKDDDMQRLFLKNPAINIARHFTGVGPFNSMLKWVFIHSSPEIIIEAIKHKSLEGAEGDAAWLALYLSGSTVSSIKKDLLDNYEDKEQKIAELMNIVAQKIEAARDKAGSYIESDDESDFESDDEEDDD